MKKHFEYTYAFKNVDRNIADSLDKIMGGDGMKPQSSLSHEEFKTFAFRISTEDYEAINLMIAASGYVR